MATVDFSFYAVVNAAGDTVNSYTSYESALDSARSYNDSLPTQTEAYVIANGHWVVNLTSRRTV